MNAHASIVRHDMVLAGGLVLIMATALFAWSPSLRPDFSPASLTPPTITYYAQSPDTRARFNQDPALIALSAAMMLPRTGHGKTDTVTPPLTSDARFLSFTDKPTPKQNDHIIMLTPRPMSTPTLQRFAPHLPTHDNNVIWTRRPAVSPRAYQIDFAGNWQGRSIDLTPVLALDEPAAPWSFTAVLRYDEDGRVQHALLESEELDATLRNKIAQRLYQCRIIPHGTPGEGRLTVSGPGRAARP